MVSYSTTKCNEALAASCPTITANYMINSLLDLLSGRSQHIEICMHDKQRERERERERVRERERERERESALASCSLYQQLVQ